ncbi:TPA: PepSY domain-containing protein [Staphylococcus aureus]|nr:PepSY domain-containing protein [Staphylococcus aureus]
MKNTFNPLQRLHFYAAIFIAPLLITLTISGIGYLFFPEVENNIYKNEFFGDSDVKTHQTLNDAVHQVERQYEGFFVSKVSILDEPYNKRITLSDMAGNQRYVFLDHNNQFVADQNAKHTYSNVMRSIHSSLFTENTIINYLVELTACWTIFMILSGTYLLIKKHLISNKSKALRWQKWHAMIGVIIAIPVFVLVLTGLPWSGFMGSKIAGMMDTNGDLGQGELAINPPKSDLNELPWATRKNKQPASSEKGSSSHHGNAGVTGLDVSPYKEQTLYFDQYSGKKLGTIKYDDYGIIAKWFTWGIPLHEGHLFGILNKIINLFVCIALLVAIGMGFVSWIKRTKNTAVKVPHRVKKPASISLIICLIVLGLLMPLFGLSLILVFIIELILYIKDRRAKQ